MVLRGSDHCLIETGCFFWPTKSNAISWCQRGILIFFPMARAAPAVFFVYRIYIWVFPKIEAPQNGWFIMETLLKWMIWGYHYFRKHPSGVAWFPQGNHLGCPYSSGLSLSRQRTTYSNLEAAQEIRGNSGDLWLIRGTYCWWTKSCTTWDV